MKWIERTFPFKSTCGRMVKVAAINFHINFRIICGQEGMRGVGLADVIFIICPCLRRSAQGWPHGLWETTVQLRRLTAHKLEKANRTWQTHCFVYHCTPHPLILVKWSHTHYFLFFFLTFFKVVRRKVTIFSSSVHVCYTFVAVHIHVCLEVWTKLQRESTVRLISVRWNDKQ